MALSILPDPLPSARADVTYAHSCASPEGNEVI